MHLARALDALEEPPDEATVAALLLPLLEDTTWVDTLIAMLVHEAACDPSFEPPLPSVASEVQSGLQLYAGRHAGIAIGLGALDRLAMRSCGGRGAGIYRLPRQCHARPRAGRWRRDPVLLGGRLA
jgi:hypothetical protein